MIATISLIERKQLMEQSDWLMQMMQSDWLTETMGSSNV